MKTGSPKVGLWMLGVLAELAALIESWMPRKGLCPVCGERECSVPSMCKTLAGVL